MINTRLLSALTEEQGLSFQGLSAKSGISSPRLASIFDGTDDITADEIQSISEALELTDRRRRAVFFNRKFTIRLSHDAVNA